MGIGGPHGEGVGECWSFAFLGIPAETAGGVFVFCCCGRCNAENSFCTVGGILV